MVSAKLPSVYSNPLSLVEIELKNQTDPSALDQAIRNKLNLSKPGETVLVITDSESDVSVPTTQQAEKQSDRFPSQNYKYIFQ
jgi:hypothetical protein